MSSELRVEQCGWIAPHEPHASGFLFAISRCPGVPKDAEYRVSVRGIRAFSDLRDETAPLLRRMFRGIIVDIDERVVTSTMPPPVLQWHGASIDIYGADYQLANSLEEHLYHEFEFVREHDRLGMGVTILTDDERARVLAHRTNRETT